MLPYGIANPRQLTILTKALADYSHAAHIEPGTQEDDHADMVWMLFESGVETPEALRHGPAPQQVSSSTRQAWLV